MCVCVLLFCYAKLTGVMTTVIDYLRYYYLPQIIVDYSNIKLALACSILHYTRGVRR